MEEWIPRFDPAPVCVNRQIATCLMRAAPCSNPTGMCIEMEQFAPGLTGRQSEFYLRSAAIPYRDLFKVSS